MKEELAARLENEPKRGSSGIAREYETQARRARRREHTASLDLSLELIGPWFRDLIAVATGCEDQVLNADRLDLLREDAQGRDVARLIDCGRAVRRDAPPARAQRARGPRAGSAVRPPAPLLKRRLNLASIPPQATPGNIPLQS